MNLLNLSESLTANRGRTFPASVGSFATYTGFQPCEEQACLTPQTLLRGEAEPVRHSGRPVRLRTCRSVRKETKNMWMCGTRFRVVMRG
ncbi:MAG: hypothetical protein JWR26_164 [Pedosphaera sp.]|nr:hypothetical protein [Pedosphaera sp.]